MMQTQNIKSMFNIKKKLQQDDIRFEDFLASLGGFEENEALDSLKLFISESLLRKAATEGIPLYLEFEIAASYNIKKKIDSFIYHNPQKTPSEIKPQKIGMYAKIGVGHFCTLLDEVQEAFTIIEDFNTVNISQYISHVGCNLFIYPQYLQHHDALNFMPANTDYYVYSIGIELYPQHYPLTDDFQISR